MDGIEGDGRLGTAGGTAGHAAERARGLLAFAACAFLWSTSGIFIKLLPWNPFLIAGARSLISSLFLLAWLRRPHFHWSAAQVIAGFLNATTMMLFVYANKTTTSANAILLQYSAPVITAIAGAIMLKERPKPEEIVAFVFVMVGMGIFFYGSFGAAGSFGAGGSGVRGGGAVWGDLAAAASGITFGLYFVFMRMQKKGSPLESNLLSHWITAAIMLPASFIFFPLPQLTALSVVAILCLGVLQVGLASVFFAYGIKRVTAAQGVLMAVIEPVFNPLWVFLFVGELPAATSLAGGLVIMAAVTAASLVGARRERRAAAAAAP